MTILSPRYFGYEGVLYWDTTSTLFNVDPVTETVTNPDILSWLSGANISDDVMRVNYSLERQRVDRTSRNRALQGWTKQKMLINNPAINFSIHHVRTSASLVRELIDAVNTIAEIPLGIVDSVTAPRQGLLGNFDVQITKSEALRGIQMWDVIAVPNSWVEYWRE